MQLKLSGSFLAGPADGVGSGFPSMTISELLVFLPNSDGLTYQVSTGVQTVNVNTSSPSWRTLPGCGPSDVVTKGNFVYFKSNGSFWIRLTFDDGLGGDVLSVLPLSGGPLFMPVDQARFLKLIEAQGSGQLLYLVTGNQ